MIDEIHHVVDVTEPIPANVAIYEKIMPVFLKAGNYLAEIGDLVAGLDLA
jgi:hypothetical protein